MSKNIKKIQAMLDEKSPRKIQVGAESKTIYQREEGEKWIDANGREWVKENGILHRKEASWKFPDEALFSM